MADVTTLVVVAIPKEDDHVWDISSEKVPHMTLLFLGDVTWSLEEISQAAGFVEHASSLMTRFGMSVDRRGELGMDHAPKADVLFFDDKGWSFDKINHFREGLMANDVIKKAWLEADQFPTWIPHLTLGFPDRPAHKETRDWPISWVEFDRIALWTSDSDGPTFVLENEDDMVMSQFERGQAVIDEILSHHGVKGMKWGVRKSRVSKGRTTFSKAPSKLSSSELTRRINRMETEKKYNSLNARDKSKGKQIAEEILTNSGKRIATTVLTGAGLALIRTAIAAKFGEGVAAEATRRLK